MPSDFISYQNSGYFIPIIIDYLNRKKSLDPFFNSFPTIKNFGEQIAEKAANYPSENRQVLVRVLEKQYSGINTPKLTSDNLSLLQSSETFTITTGHQLNLFTGPLYFLYKIISAINLAKELKANYPQNDFVPVYWMATEDHDFEEINYFSFNGRKFRWNRESSGPVGKLETEGIDEVFKLFALELGSGNYAEAIKTMFSEAYIKHSNLTDATRYLANELFGKYGLVILDADDRDLKQLFAPHIQTELLNQVSHKCVSETITALSDYDVQVNPREINLFYMDLNLRERIIFDNEKYLVNNTTRSFSKSEILDELEKHPERFSPNVVMRPLYEEVILPNLCYIGGGGELAYWFELKSYFDSAGITFPILLLRNSVLVATEKQSKKVDKLKLSWADLFQRQADLVNNKIREISEFPIDLTAQKQTLIKQFEELATIAATTDRSFTGAVEAQRAKQIKGLDNLEKRLLKAQKRKHADELERIIELQNELFPYKALQERQVNFSQFYLMFGELFIENLLTELKPLDDRFNVLVL